MLVTNPPKSASRCKDKRSALKTNPFTKPPKTEKGNATGDEKEKRISIRDVTSLMCKRF